MSRIHEALRKAAVTDSLADAPPADGQSGSDGEEPLSSDLFPVEAPPRRQVTSEPSRDVLVTEAVTRIAAPTAVPEPAHYDHLSFERIDTHYAGKVVIDQEISGESREQYRRLAASLHHAQAATAIKVVMLTSAVMGEGKTLTSSNLALTLSESYQKNVLLIDADLRRPALHRLFRIRSSSGLIEGLTDAGQTKVPVHQISSRLGILAAGRATSDPIAGLTSTRMRKLLDEARGSFDWIILDTPPVALLPDANLLGSMVDGAVVVVRADSTPWDLVQRAVAAIGQERLLGVVLNGATAQQGREYSYNYYYAQGRTTSA